MARKGWHKAEIKAALEKRGLTLIALDRLNAFPRGLCSAALFKPHRAPEQAIAQALGQPPHLIWPERYHPDGTRISPQPAENYKSHRGASPRQKREAA